MGTKLEQVLESRRGVAMVMVLLIGIVILVLGMAMIVTSGGLLQSTVDSKQRIRSRYAAESMVELQMAKLDKLKDSLLGGQLNLSAVSMGLGTANGESGKVDPVKLANTKGQELITSGTFAGMQGLKVPFMVHTIGMAPGGARTVIDANLYLYQVPLFQFGVFYQGNLEITPGPPMYVQGPVHTNGNAYFRAAGSSWNASPNPVVLSFQGPISVTGKLYHWVRPDAASDGEIHYYRIPTDPSSPTVVAKPQTALTLMNTAIPNVAQNAPALNLPIGGVNPHELIMPCTGTESAALRYQKFDCMVQDPTKANATIARFVYTGTAPSQSWITGPKVFFDRREDRWVKVWDFDVTAALTNSNDSIFYLYDGSPNLTDRGNLGDVVINAFRLIHGSPLSRNVSITSGNPIYVQGNFNGLGGPCRPADDPSGDVTKFYCNAMIASDAFTVLSSSWPLNDYAHDGMGIFVGNTGNGVPIFHGTLEQDLSLGAPGSWTGGQPEHLTAYTDAFGGNDTINAAILTGSLPTNPATIPPILNNFTETNYEANYEGGWHNTIRFLEDWSGATLYFRGSFVCLWSQANTSLRTACLPQFGTKVFGTRYFNPPTRNWGFDTRFTSINNMPPGTPFLSTNVYANWSERQ